MIVLVLLDSMKPVLNVQPVLTPVPPVKVPIPRVKHVKQLLSEHQILIVLV